MVIQYVILKKSQGKIVTNILTTKCISYGKNTRYSIYNCNKTYAPIWFICFCSNNMGLRNIEGKNYPNNGLKSLLCSTPRNIMQKPQGNCLNMHIEYKKIAKEMRWPSFSREKDNVLSSFHQGQHRFYANFIRNCNFFLRSYRVMIWYDNMPGAPTKGRHEIFNQIVLRYIR